MRLRTPLAPLLQQHFFVLAHQARHARLPCVLAVAAAAAAAAGNPIWPCMHEEAGCRAFHVFRSYLRTKFGSCRPLRLQHRLEQFPTATAASPTPSIHSLLYF